MKVTIYEDQDGTPRVSVEGDISDSPEAVAQAWKKANEELVRKEED